MGQYYLTVNLDKKEYLYPHDFSDGLKLLEFGSSASGLMTGLAILLADGNNRGGGDLRSEHPIIGSWAGDRIVIAGDYADPGNFLEDAPQEELQAVAEEAYTEGHQEAKNVTLYAYARQHFRNISSEVIDAMADDAYLRQDLLKRLADPYTERQQEIKKRLLEKEKGARA